MSDSESFDISSESADFLSDDDSIDLAPPPPKVL